MNIIHAGTYKARKKYKCNSCEDFTNNLSIERGDITHMTPDEQEVMKQAILIDKGFINIGEVYERQFNSDDGDTWTWRAKIGVSAIMSKYKLHSEC